MLEIKFFEAPNGRRPFIDWLEDLRDQKARAIIRTRLDRLRLGDFGRHRPLGEEVLELKIDFGPGYRLYFGRIGGSVVLLLCGGDKGSQGRDVRRAKLYFKQYRSDHGY